jgi:hypothetical protein
MRAMITADPYTGLDAGKPWIERGIWPCSWVACPGAGQPPFVSAYRLRFCLEAAATVRAHVSADERYELFLDGRRVGRGSERGDLNNWFYETYDLPLSAGEHVLVARVWSLGSLAPYAQMTLYPGFIFATEGEWTKRLGTGHAPWEAKLLSGYHFLPAGVAWGTGAKLEIVAEEFDWGWERGEGQGWQPVLERDPGANGFIRNERPPLHLMKPATLPDRLEDTVQAGRALYVAPAQGEDTHAQAVRAADSLPSEVAAWNRLLSGEGSVTLPAGTVRRVIIDLGNYYCAFPELLTSGGKGSSLRLLWAEALYEQPEARSKGNRNEIEGKYFVGVGDRFLPDGGSQRLFSTLWWEAGRYLEVLVQVADEPLTIEALRLRETHYPLGMKSEFHSSDQRLQAAAPIMVRALQMCAHETYMDCPYYEQLQYVGDTRLECLATYAIERDDRLPRKALRLFDQSRLVSGLTQSRYPSRVLQVIPPFSLWWVGMVYDYSLWRDDAAFVKSLMPGVRAVIDCYTSFINDEGLLQAPNGWNFLDWVPSWQWGEPPDADFGVSGPLNWQFVLALSMLAELEAAQGESELAARARRLAAELADRVAAAFWAADRHLFADDLAHQRFSEHSQCLAILSGQLTAERRDEVAAALLSDPKLERTTIYFTHYLFEAYRLLGQADAFFQRLGLWFELEQRGFKTTFEMPEPSRSDCHAWGAHPLYHYFATILGIRPASPGFRSVEIRPQLGPLTSVRGTLVHPRGEIKADFYLEQGQLRGSVTLPAGVNGVLHYDGTTRPLAGGENRL